MNGGVTLTRRLRADHPAFAGHFPGRPLLPGVVLLSEVLEAVLADATLAALVGERPVIASAKFLAPVSPVNDATIELVIALQPQAGGLRFEVSRDAVTVARGQFAAGVDP